MIRIIDRLLNGRIFTSLLAVVLASSSAFALGADKTANLGAFADQTIALLSQPDYGFTSDEVVLVRGYYDRNNPAVKKLQDLGQRGADLFNGLGDYSVQLAGLGGQRISEAERIAQLHSYLTEIKPNIISTIDFPSTAFDTMLDNVAAQESFLKAIRQVQPMVNAAGRYGQLLITEYEDTILQVESVIDAAIQEDYAVMLAYTEALEVRHGETLADVARLADSESPSNREAQLLKAKLDRMGKIFEFISPRWDLYKLTREELNTLRRKAFASTVRERVALLLWVRAHQRMAAGMGGSSWFDYGDLIKEQLGL